MRNGLDLSTHFSFNLFAPVLFHTIIYLFFLFPLAFTSLLLLPFTIACLSFPIQIYVKKKNARERKEQKKKKRKPNPHIVYVRWIEYRFSLLFTKETKLKRRERINPLHLEYTIYVLEIEKIYKTKEKETESRGGDTFNII